MFVANREMTQFEAWGGFKWTENPSRSLVHPCVSHALFSGFAVLFLQRPRIPSRPSCKIKPSIWLSHLYELTVFSRNLKQCKCVIVRACFENSFRSTKHIVTCMGAGFPDTSLQLLFSLSYHIGLPASLLFPGYSFATEQVFMKTN